MEGAIGEGGTSEARAALLGPAARLGLRLAVAAIALWWAFQHAPVSEVVASMRRFSAVGVGAALALYCALIVSDAVRWGLLIAAYGGARIPLVTRVKLAVLGNFFNTFLPGAVLGDLARSHLTRKAFGGGPGAYVVVFLGRILGLVALLILCGTVQLVRPVTGVQPLAGVAVLGIAAATAIALLPFAAQWLGARLPGPIGPFLASFPVLTNPAPFAAALGIAIWIQTGLALCAHAMLHGLAPEVPLTDSLVVVPLALVSVYFPATVAGLGVRELAFIGLYGLVGVDAADATAVSLGLLGLQAVTALPGGVIHLVGDVELPPR